MHNEHPTVLDMGCIWDHVRRLYERESSFVRRLLRHSPEKSAFWVWGMTTDVERSFRRVETSYNLETRFVDSTFWFLGVLQSDTDLVAPFRVLIGLEDLQRLREIVFDEVEEVAVILLLHPRVVHDEGTVRDDRSCGLIEWG